MLNRWAGFDPKRLSAVQTFRVAGCLAGLTPRTLRFARLYAEKPDRTISAAARAAGYSDRARGAHVRGSELLRDPRVVRAILHFGALALARAREHKRSIATRTVALSTAVTLKAQAEMDFTC
jgi:hypothetical protein